MEISEYIYIIKLYIYYYIIYIYIYYNQIILYIYDLILYAVLTLHFALYSSVFWACHLPQLDHPPESCWIFFW